ncbi:aspartate aminotransferase family protein [Spirosoma montaniterrae]|uniref:4-aminobutyrate aminotransferase n=1 Tax=Spirosoma montaniterrae TaxID=1178516 RepID=A0A1P9WX31_9BACT|nr:aspartate aminotransferase family protein [Spirosoma montaniterrae]AQG79878.1 4-aminobutyrate aminotransferase [Spirosoma montaniterrae]
MNSQELLQRRNAVVPKAMVMSQTLDAAYAHGATFVSHDGREYIDFSGGIGVLNAGHCPEPVVEAIREQAGKLMHTFFNLLTHEPFVLLAEKLVDILPHGEATKVMMVSTGAEAVENAIKIARQATGRQGIICYTGGFHGRTTMGMTLTSKVSYKLGCGPFAPEVYRIPFPDYYHNGHGQDFDAFVEQELANFRKYLSSVVAPENVAAVILEPVLGEGGFYVTPKRYLQGLRQLCDEYGILLILDEVQSGFGRTGRWAAYEHYDIVPDISTWAKSMGSGIPIACVMGKAEVMDKARPGTLGGTYAGNPVACAASLATIRYMEDIDINRLGERVGEMVYSFFRNLQTDCSAIGDVRGLGAMVAIELVKNGDPNQPDTVLTQQLVAACAARGLFLISAGIYSNVIRVLSPLVIEDDLLQKGLTIMREELLRLTVSEEVAAV